MTEYPIFNNAPITEALLDIQATLDPDVDLTTLARFHDEVRDRFPIRHEQSWFELQVAAEEDAALQVSQSGGVNGYLLLTSDSNPTKVVQVRRNGFTFSKLKPYESWTKFRDEARELWQQYSNVARPMAVTRLGLRNINRIELPVPFRNSSEYFLTGPDVGPGIPHGVSSFFMRLVMPQVESSAIAVVTMAMDASQASTTSLPVVFDIDVSMEDVMYDPASDELWTSFEELRRIKNTIFFNSITDATKELFR